MDEKMEFSKKDVIRKEILGRLREQEASLREERSMVIQNKLLASEEYKAASMVMTYVSLPTEVDTEYINKKALEQGKRVAVPYMGPDECEITVSEIKSFENLKKGPFGIYQPGAEDIKSIKLEEIDLVIVPAVGFDKQNLRLGRGKGCYDKFLARDELSSADTIGLAFHFQMLDILPTDPHDLPVSRVLTD